MRDYNKRGGDSIAIKDVNKINDESNNMKVNNKLKERKESVNRSEMHNTKPEINNDD